MFGLEEKQGERENGTLNCGKNSRSELRHCQRPGIILDEGDYGVEEGVSAELCTLPN